MGCNHLTDCDRCYSEVEKRNEAIDALMSIMKSMQKSVQSYLIPDREYADDEWLIEHIILSLDCSTQREAFKMVEDL